MKIKLAIALLLIASSSQAAMYVGGGSSSRNSSVSFDNSPASTQQYGDSATTGAAATASRRDHKHGIPAAITSIPGNAGTATALIANGTNCPDGQAPLGVDSGGNAEGCWTPSGATGGGYTYLTSFIDQTPWRVFYSDGSGDVKELALGANGTYLKSNGSSSVPSFATPTSAFDPAAPGAIGGTTPAAGTFTTITGSAFATSAADGARYSEIPNTVTLTSTPTLGRIAWLSSRFWLANGTNWTSRYLLDSSFIGSAVQAYDADLTTWGGITPGSGVGAMLTNAPGVAGGPTITIASGTMALGTTAINSGACTTITPVTATGVATTDTLNWGFNGDPTGVTGYAASANGMLTIIVWPTSGNIAAKVCNNTANPVTPSSSVTINWRVMR